MAVPTPLHYWLVRLRVFRRRRVWATALGFLILGLVGHQYLNHPEWLQGFTLDEADRARSAEAELSELSQAELADLAEVDNLALLLNQLQPLTANTLAEVPNAAQQPENLAGLAQPSPTAVEATPSADGASPFAAYLERTQFRVGSLATLDDPSATESPSPDRLSLARTAPLSPLQRFLAPSASAASDAENPSSPEAEDSPSAASASEPRATTPTTTTGLTPPPWVVEGNVPGVNQPFIRTTPEMSPPPGTTGYALPPSLGTTSRQGLPSVPATPGLPLAPPLNLSPNPASSGSVTVPGPGGNTLPPSSGLSTYTQPAGIPEPAPFSAPRPPGTYTGGGYINTFSDPSGPVD